MLLMCVLIDVPLIARQCSALRWQSSRGSAASLLLLARGHTVPSWRLTAGVGSAVLATCDTDMDCSWVDGWAPTPCLRIIHSTSIMLTGQASTVSVLTTGAVRLPSTGNASPRSSGAAQQATIQNRPVSPL